MNSYTIAFVVHGHPQRWERTGPGNKFGGQASRNRNSKADVAAYFEHALEDLGYPDQDFPWQGPCSLKLRAVFQKPTEWWPGKECIKTPDVDNLAKLVQDALNGVAYRDDRQLVRLEVERAYGDREHSEIELHFWTQPPKPSKRPAKEPAGQTLFS